MASRKALAGLGGVAVAVAATFFGVTTYENNAAPAQSSSGIQQCKVSTLPKEATPVIKSIKSGGPYKYPNNDGVHFGNYEKHLPKNKYLEYTVDTPGVNHRGERRIITGGGTKTNPEHWYYTADHYETFCEIPDA